MIIRKGCALKNWVSCFLHLPLKGEVSAGPSVGKTRSSRQILAKLERPENIGVQKGFHSPPSCLDAA